MQGIDSVAMLLLLIVMSVYFTLAATAFRLLGTWRLLVVPTIVVPLSLIPMFDEYSFAYLSWLHPEILFAVGLLYLALLMLVLPYNMPLRRSQSADASQETTTLATKNGCATAALTVASLGLILVTWLWMEFIVWW